MKRLILASAGLLALVGAAIAQTTTLPLQPAGTTSATADRIQIIPRGQGTAQSVYVSPGRITATSVYAKNITTTFGAQTPATCGTATTGGLTTCPGYNNYFGDTQTLLTFNIGGTMTYTYVTLAQTPNDGATECVFSTNTVTQFNLASYASVATVTGALTALVANTRYCYTYSASNTTWDRSQ